MRCGGSCRQRWPTIQFRGWVRQEAWCERISVISVLRQCACRMIFPPRPAKQLSLLAFLIVVNHSSKGVWFEVLSWLQEDPDDTAIALLDRLKSDHPDRFKDTHLRTLQRRVQQWRGIMAQKLV